MTLAEKIYKDYIDVIKIIVTPAIKSETKLNLREVRVLMSLGYTTAAVSASELAEQLRHDPSTVTRSLVVLIKGGYIKTFENQADGRSKMIALTQAGRDLATKCHDILDSFLAEIDGADGMEDSQRSDDVYVERLMDISQRASFVLEQAKRKN
jgi:DNA-binding MarR family transcriptional regulator